MQILICCDKFKGTLGANEVCLAIASGIQKIDPSVTCTILPLADGGDGTGLVLKHVLGLNEIQIDTIDALGRPIQAKYYNNQETAFIELAEASGMWRLKPDELDVLETTTIGTGVLMKDAITSGFKKIVLSLGGSSTNDVGLGIAQSLGFIFLDKSGNELIPKGAKLSSISEIVNPQQPIDVSLRILCDVNNTLYGPNGAAQVFARQKGASDQTITILDEGMRQVAQLILETTGKQVENIEGSGAAGGIAAGLFGLLDNVQIVNGFNYLSEILNLSEAISTSDLVITGEGRLDQQSLQGKVVGEVAKLCQVHQKELMVVAGSSHLNQRELSGVGISRCHALEARASSQADSMAHPERYLKEVGEELIKSL